MERLEITLPQQGILLGEYLKVVLYYINGSGIKKTWKGDRIVLEGNRIAESLKGVLQIVKERLETVKKENEQAGKINIEIPISGNDKKKLKNLYDFLGVSETRSPVLDSIRAYIEKLGSGALGDISSALGEWADGYPNDASIVKIPLIEIFKPERYEYGRSQGYVGERDKDILLGPHSTILGVAGYILARQSRRIRVDKDQELASIAIPDDPTLRERVFDTKISEAHRKGMDGIYSGYIPGIANTEALALWLGWLWKDAADLPEELSNITLYLIEEPGGQRPAYLRGRYSMNIGLFAQIARSVCEKGGSERYVRLLREALISKASEQPFAARVCRLAYLAITGSLHPSELVYVASRESIIGMATKAKVSRIRRIAKQVALDIQSAIEETRRTTIYTQTPQQ